MQQRQNKGYEKPYFHSNPNTNWFWNFGLSEKNKKEACAIHKRKRQGKQK